MEFKISILTFSFSIIVIALKTYLDLQRNIHKFGYGINYKYLLNIHLLKTVPSFA